jgi:hypothetical protein
MAADDTAQSADIPTLSLITLTASHITYLHIFLSFQQRVGNKRGLLLLWTIDERRKGRFPDFILHSFKAKPSYPDAEEIAEKKKRCRRRRVNASHRAQALHPHSAGDGVGLESLAKSYKRFQKTHVYFSLNSIFMPSKTLVRACSLQDLTFL